MVLGYVNQTVLKKRAEIFYLALPVEVIIGFTVTYSLFCSSTTSYQIIRSASANSFVYTTLSYWTKTVSWRASL